MWSPSESNESISNNLNPKNSHTEMGDSGCISESFHDDDLNGISGGLQNLNIAPIEPQQHHKEFAPEECINDSGCIDDEDDDNNTRSSEQTQITQSPLEQLIYVNQATSWQQYFRQNDDGDTCLHLACLSGHEVVVGTLIRLTPDPFLLDIQNDDGQTPLHVAAIVTQSRILRMLLLAGAKPTIRDCQGNTALHLACISGDEQCVSALIIPFSIAEINEAYREQRYRSADKMALQQSLDIRNYNGERCVHLAAQGGYIKILSILMQQGADINARDGRSGRTPLHISIEKCNDEMVSFLLNECKQQLDLEKETFAGLTAYQMAGILSKSEMQRILENCGAEALLPPVSDYESSESDLDESLSDETD